jgi:hypothetical protein
MAVTVTAGVDTWSPCWRLHEDSDAAAAIDQLATRPTRRGRLVEEPIDGHRIMWFPSAGLLAAEGHPAGEGNLATPNVLPEALQRLTGALEASMGAQLPTARRFAFSEHGHAGIRRLDTAVNLAWDGESREGLALLAGLAALVPPGKLQSVIRRQPGGRAYETVAWHGRRGLVARAYDKGVEGNLAARGQLVRLEDQRRWPNNARREVEELTGDYVRETWRRRFMPLWQATKGLKIVTTQKLAQELRAAVDEGRCSQGEAVGVAAQLLMESAGVRPLGHRQTRWRRATKARELGLVLADGVLQEQEFDVAEIMGAALDTDAWERVG